MAGKQQPPPAAGEPPQRRASPRVLIAAAVVLVLVVAGVVLALALTGGDDSSDDGNAATQSVATLAEAGEVRQLLDGIPQNGNVLGDPNAPVTVIEYVDLQCPYCRSFDIDAIPELVKRYVRTGQAKLELRFLGTLGPDSQRGRGAALAAAKQDKMFQFVQLLYLHQGAENSDWLTDTLIRRAAASAGADPAAVLSDRLSTDVANEAAEMDQQAVADRVQVTPTILVGKSDGRLQQVAPESPDDFRSVANAIDNALSG